MFGLLKTRRGRLAAVALIGPFVDGSRQQFHLSSEDIWLRPYLVGFMGMLITMVAERAAGRLNSQAAGIVQLEAWRQITGFGSDLIGEEICLLSAAHNRLFNHGCVNAGRFLEGLIASASAPHPDAAPPGYAVHGIAYDPQAAIDLWAECFEAFLSAANGT